MKSFHLVLAILFILSVPIKAEAHKLGVYAWQEGGQVIAEGYFVDGSPCAPCNIKAYDAATGSLLANAPTSSEGTITFESSGRSLRLVLTAPGGHRAEETITLEEAKGPEGPEGSKTPFPTQEGREEHKMKSQPPLRSMLLGLAIIAGMAGLWAMTRKR